MYYQAKVKVKIEKESGGFRKQTLNYLVDAVSVTDVEVYITQEFTGSVSDWELTSVSETKIEKVLGSRV